MKRKSKFKIALLIYVGIWLIGILGVNIKLWDFLSNYQQAYVYAAESSNPDLVMDELIAKLTSTFISEHLQEWKQNISKYENAKNIEKYISSIVDGKEVTYKRAENFKDRKPRYTILAGRDTIGEAVLTQNAESDSYGFHKYELDEVNIQTPDIVFSDVTVVIPKGAELFVNTVKVDDSDITEVKELSSAMAKKASELSGNSFAKVTYQMNGFLEEPLINMTNHDNTVTLEKNAEGIYDGCQFHLDQYSQDLKDFICNVAEKYILNANQLLSFGEMAQFVTPHSNAYENILSVQSGLTWAGKPDQLDILEKQIVDIQKYSDEIYTAKTVCKIHRLYREVTYDEEMTYEWLITFDGTKWTIEDFALAKN